MISHHNITTGKMSANLTDVIFERRKEVKKVVDINVRGVWRLRQYDRNPSVSSTTSSKLFKCEGEKILAESRTTLYLEAKASSLRSYRIRKILVAAGYSRLSGQLPSFKNLAVHNF
jgi:hypothetical protein